jgi:hypothetical protein
MELLAALPQGFLLGLVGTRDVAVEGHGDRCAYLAHALRIGDRVETHRSFAVPRA